MIISRASGALRGTLNDSGAGPLHRERRVAAIPAHIERDSLADFAFGLGILEDGFIRMRMNVD
jgi:hypothetical protein